MFEWWRTMCFLTMSSKPCLETHPHRILETPLIGHRLGALWGVIVSSRPCLQMLPCNSLQTKSAGHCLDALARRIILQLQLLRAKSQWEYLRFPGCSRTSDIKATLGIMISHCFWLPSFASLWFSRSCTWCAWACRILQNHQGICLNWPSLPWKTRSLWSATEDAQHHDGRPSEYAPQEMRALAYTYLSETSGMGVLVGHANGLANLLKNLFLSSS